MAFKISTNKLVPLKMKEKLDTFCNKTPLLYIKGHDLFNA